MSNSQKLTYFSLSFIGGICVASYFFSFSSIFFIIGIILILFKGKEKIIIVGFCFIFFSIGMFRFESEFKKINENFLINFDQKEVILTGVISGEVKKGNDKTQMIVDVFDKGRVVGKALVFTDKYSFYEYRDKIKIEGKILVPQNLEGFDYKGYLSKSQVSVIISYPEIEIIERKFYSNSFQKIQYFIYEFKNSKAEKIKDLLPPKLSPILEAMILGNDTVMSKELKEDLSRSGLSHAIAISGSHIVLFSTMIFWV
ncbi:MAG: ComEC/Rec2 family competence protein, partial [Candidatus Pacebacteria bacterium]|nr:ComEC/Rec2 family competence protein [Candidatus Paceibacterota bacterium]